MWKEQLKGNTRNIFILQFCLILSLIGQGEIKAIITKHNLQSFTARAKFQSLLFDHNGLMYIASSEGIILYNGVTGQFINNSDNAGFHGVSSMVEDKKGIIWIACDDGQIFRIYNKELTNWSPQEGLPKRKISKLLVDDKNQLWIATKGEGIYVFNQTYLYQFGLEDGLIHLDINDMVHSKEKGIIVSSDQGIQALNFKNGLKSGSHVKMSCWDNKEIVQDLEYFNDHLYLNNLSTGIIEWNLTTDSCSLIRNNKDVELTVAISISSDYQVLMTEKNLYIKSGESDQYISLKSNLDISEIQYIALDKHNTLWILHKSKGLLSIYLPITIFELPGKTIQDIEMSSDGNHLFLCTDSGLLIVQASDGKLISTYFQGENLTTIFQDKNADIFWIGSYGKGLIRFNALTKKSKRLKKENGLPDNSILQITGTDRFIWIATLAGILRMDHTGGATEPSNLKIFNQENGLPTNFIYQIFPDPTDRIWIGTDGNGINYLDKDAYCIEQVMNESSTHNIYNFEYNQRNILFFNSSREGLGYLDIKKDTLAWIESPSKNFEYDCIALMKDSILLTAGSGFLMLSDPKRQLSIIMDEEFGLTEIVPSLNAIYKDKNANLWIGCKNSLIRVQSNVLFVLTRPQNSFSNIKVLDRFIRPGKDSLFEYDENQFSFEFNAIHYLASDHLHYRYMLEGYDKGWTYSKEGNESFSNLSPGKYRFVAQSSIDKNFDSSNEIDYSFKVLKPVWLRRWFIGLIIIGILILVRYFVQRREEIKNKEEVIRRKTSELEFEILKSQVNPHFLFNSFNSVISLIEDDKDKAIEFTEKLSDYFRNILKYRNKQLIPMEEEMFILKNYLELLRLRHPNQIVFELGNVQQHNWIAPMTLQLLMENAIKHNEISINNPLKITVFCQNDFLVFENSIMRKKTNMDSTGFGLESIRLRYRLLTDKDIRIEKGIDYFRVEIPLIEKQV